MNDDISEREYEIKTLDEERAKLFKSLKAKSAFNDLTQAFLYSGELQNQFADLGSKVGTYKELVTSKNAWQVEDARNSIQMGKFITTTGDKIREFKGIFNYVYESIYPSSNNNSSINISQSLGRAKHKIEINVSFSSEDSKGRNKGRTLIYDLAILLNIIKQKLHRPKFLVHDGIFDGMDKAHFVDIYHFVQQEQIKGNRFQYIITLNEEGTLSQDFGATDKLTPEKISEDAIVVLTPNHKLLNL